MLQPHRLVLRRLAAIATAAGILLLVIAGCALAGSREQPATQPATVAAGSSQNTFDQGSGGQNAVGGDQERRKTPTPTPRPRRTPAATPTATTTTTPTTTPTRAGPQRVDGLPVIYVDQLPREARTALRLIEEGGPFPYAKDGAVFQNRERILPSRPRGYYHEYTVVTPGENDRGARRVVAGEGGELYYTDDHYDSFARIMER